LSLLIERELSEESVFVVTAFAFRIDEIVGSMNFFAFEGLFELNTWSWSLNNLPEKLMLADFLIRESIECLLLYQFLS
jgi:hypothetical protein